MKPPDDEPDLHAVIDTVEQHFKDAHQLDARTVAALAVLRDVASGTVHDFHDEHCRCQPVNLLDDLGCLPPVLPLALVELVMHRAASTTIPGFRLSTPGEEHHSTPAFRLTMPPGENIEDDYGCVCGHYSGRHTHTDQPPYVAYPPAQLLDERRPDGWQI